MWSRAMWHGGRQRPTNFLGKLIRTRFGARQLRRCDRRREREPLSIVLHQRAPIVTKMVSGHDRRARIAALASKGHLDERHRHDSSIRCGRSMRFLTGLGNQFRRECEAVLELLRRRSGLDRAEIDVRYSHGRAHSARAAPNSPSGTSAAAATPRCRPAAPEAKPQPTGRRLTDGPRYRR